MRPRVLAWDGQASTVDAVAGALAAGKLAVLPTDTVYGVAVHPEAGAAGLGRIRAAKGRDADKPIALLVRDAGVLTRWSVAPVPDHVQALADRHWPGPLTLVLQTAEGMEGFRVPAHDATLAVLGATGGALRVTSANLAGNPPARTVAEALAALAGHVSCALDAGPLQSREVSSVVRWNGRSLELLREGALSAADLDMA